MKTHMLILAASLLALHTSALAADPADYVAHEWGTFTSVQGADGVQLDWNPLVTTELPTFVYDRNRLRNGRPGPAILLSKTGFVARQRLETPVIYFYSKETRSVDVSVKFPEGNVTEWYPQQNPLPSAIKKAGEPAARWDKVRVLAAGAKAPAFPHESKGSHYYAARVAEANAVQVAVPDGPVQTENFLFYRGVGQFAAPLKVEIEDGSTETWRATNTGTEALAGLLLCELRQHEGRLLLAGNLAPGESRGLSLLRREAFLPIEQIKEQMREQMRKSLIAAGLYASEADAMIKTWDDSWFAEHGVRVLYLLPRPWADRVLPLSLNPVPREVARVMVGRAEILTPGMEKALTQEVERYRSGNETTRAIAVENARSLGLGRFAEPAVRRLCMADPKNRDFSNAAWQLLYGAFAPPAPAPATAAR